MPTTIYFKDHQIRISGDGLRALRDSLAVQTLDFTVNDGNITIQTGKRAFYQPVGPDIVLPLPLLPRAERVLTSHGVTLEREGVPLFRHLVNADSQWAQRVGLGLSQRKLASVLLDSPFGQIVHHIHAGKLEALATIIHLFPHANILFVASRRAGTRGLARALTTRSGSRVYANPEAAFEHDRKLLVATRFNFGSVNSDDWDIVVFLEPEALLTPQATQVAQRLARHGTAFYCLRSATAQLTTEEELDLESICGPVIYVGSTARGRLASVNVLFAEGAARPIDQQLGKDAGALAIKRAHYWRHAARNQRIALVATALESNNAAALERFRLSLVNVEEATIADQPTVAILVESQEHGEAVKQLLPAWQLITADPEQTRPQSFPRRLHRAIITEAAATEHEIGSDVLIVASGTVPAWERLHFPRVLGSSEEQGQQLVIDFTDEFAPQAVKQTQQRLNAYQKLGWDVLQTPRFTVPQEEPRTPSRKAGKRKAGKRTKKKRPRQQAVGKAKRT